MEERNIIREGKEGLKEQKREQTKAHVLICMTALDVDFYLSEQMKGQENIIGWEGRLSLREDVKERVLDFG